MTIRRVCSSCIHFRPGTLPCTGTCAHSERQIANSAAVLVRAAELACRSSWDCDLWAPNCIGDGIALRVWGPFMQDVIALDDLPNDLVSLLCEHDNP